MIIFYISSKYGNYEREAKLHQKLYNTTLNYVIVKPASLHLLNKVLLDPFL